jgi:hypothetical protein
VRRLFNPRKREDRLKRGHLDVNPESGEIASRLSSKLFPDLHTDDREPTLQHRSRRFTRTATNLQQAITRLQACQTHEIVEELTRVARTRRLIHLGSRVERPPQPIDRIVHCWNPPVGCRNSSW